MARPNIVAILSLLLIMMSVAAISSAQAHEQVLYSFCSLANCGDGAGPEGDLVADDIGNLYGTTSGGGANCQSHGGCGVVFQLTPNQNGNWMETLLYSFCGSQLPECPADGGSYPMAGVVFDNVGNLYGTTWAGGIYGVGIVYELSPPAHPGDAWIEAVLWNFGGVDDGQVPWAGLVIDSLGNLYGTTAYGGPYKWGTVFQLVPPMIGTQWTENVLYSFGNDHRRGGIPRGSIVLGQDGGLYGATFDGGSQYGAGRGLVYELSPNPQAPWNETVLFRFNKETGGNPIGGVAFDRDGNLFGTTTRWGAAHGTVFGLLSTGGGHVGIHEFEGAPGDGDTPYADLLVEGKTVYGVTFEGGMQGGGAIFRIEGKQESLLYSFCSQINCADGLNPQGGLVAYSGSLFGTTFNGGLNDGGVVFDISQTELKTKRDR